MPLLKVTTQYHETNRLQGLANNPVAVACLIEYKSIHFFVEGAVDSYGAQIYSELN